MCNASVQFLFAGQTGPLTYPPNGSAPNPAPSPLAILAPGNSNQKLASSGVNFSQCQYQYEHSYHMCRGALPAAFGPCGIWKASAGLNLSKKWSQLITTSYMHCTAGPVPAKASTTSTITRPASGSHHAGLIAGCIVGGLAAIALALATAGFFLGWWRFGRNKSSDFEAGRKGGVHNHFNSDLQARLLPAASTGSPMHQPTPFIEELIP